MGRPVLEAVSVMDTESEVSYASGPKSIKPTVKVVWRGGKKVMCTCNQLLLLACSFLIHYQQCFRWMRKIFCTCKRNTIGSNKLKRQMRRLCDSTFKMLLLTLRHVFTST